MINEEDLYLNKIDETGLPQVMQGIDLDQVKRFAAEFKTARINLGLTQAQVGEALNTCSTADQISVSQSTICRFEKLEITALQVKKLLPALRAWLDWAVTRTILILILKKAFLENCIYGYILLDNHRRLFTFSRLDLRR